MEQLDNLVGTRLGHGCFQEPSMWASEYKGIQGKGLHRSQGNQRYTHSPIEVISGYTWLYS